MIGILKIVRGRGDFGLSSHFGGRLQDDYPDEFELWCPRIVVRCAFCTRWRTRRGRDSLEFASESHLHHDRVVDLQATGVDELALVWPRPR